MAREQAHPSQLPRLPIEGDELRAREQGRDPQPHALRNAISELQQRPAPALEGAAPAPGLPLVAVAANDARQPIYKYFQIYGKASRASADGMIDEIVFDQKRILFNAITNVQLYAARQDNPLLAAVDENSCKVLHKNACQRARNIKKQREPVDRQAESEPPRLRTRIADARVEFCLERWNRQDAMFLHDWPHLADPAYHAQFFEKNKARAHKDMLDKAAFGPLGQLLARNRSRIADRGDRTGTSYFVSAEELGTSRLHPSVNPVLKRVRKAHYLLMMEQPRRGERECVNGHECYCYKGNISYVDSVTYFSMTNTMGFVCKEYLTPDEYIRFKLTGELPARRGTCIVCKLDDTTQLVYAMMRSEIQAQVIQDHAVYTDTEGEFALSQCLSVSFLVNGRTLMTGIVAPLPEFNEGDYLHDVRLEAGVPIRFLRYHPPRTGF